MDPALGEIAQAEKERTLTGLVDQIALTKQIAPRVSAPREGDH